jgi:ketol-acid reductoisomerase
MTRIYTRKGDDGTTSLWYGGRVTKTNARAAAYGALDEAASALGVARSLCRAEEAELAADILRLQDGLFIAGAELATAPEAADRLEPGVSKVTSEMIDRLEADIDRYMERVDLPPKFVIPGGTELSARLDVARAAVRRAERRVAALKDGGDLADETVLTYLNRLSDALSLGVSAFLSVNRMSHAEERLSLFLPSEVPGEADPAETVVVRSTRANSTVYNGIFRVGAVYAFSGRLRVGAMFQPPSFRIRGDASVRDRSVSVGALPEEQATMYYDDDADLSIIQNRVVAVIGYGSQGHAHALNLHDSGVPVIVGLREGSASAAAAREAGLEVMPVDAAVREANVVALLFPDTAQPAVYKEQVEPNLRDGNALLFAHGFNIHYKQIEPPAGVDVVLVAPKSPGKVLRREYQAGQGVPSLVGVHQDATGRALALALAYADAIGSTRAGVIETSFAHETETDLFGEQAVLCGGLAELVKAGFETLVEAGYAPELAYFECLHEMKLIVDLVYAGGVTGMNKGVSDTAEYGGYVSGDRVIGPESRAAMRELLDEIRRGTFAERWISESASGGADFERLRAAHQAHTIEAVGQDLRSRMCLL